MKKGMMVRAFKVSGLVVALALAGCNEDGSSSGGQADAPASEPVAPMSLTVTPTLGKVQGGVIRLYEQAGSLLGQIDSGSAGAVQFTLPTGYQGPLLLQVCGAEGASYFDEATGASVPLAADQCLRAIVPDLDLSSVTISAYTEAVVRRLEEQGVLATATAEQIRSVQTAVQDQLGLTVNLLSVPFIPGSPEDMQTLLSAHLLGSGDPAQVAANEYAYRLSSLARAAKKLAESRSQSVTAPAYEVALKLADDLADGTLDGQDANGYIVSPVYDIHQLNALLALVTKDELASLVNDLPANLDLTLAEGLEWLQSKGYGRPATVSVDLPSPGNSLLSWQGSYTGTVQTSSGLTSMLSIGQGLFGNPIPAVYQPVLSYLNNGAACRIDVDDDQIRVGVVDGLGQFRSVPFPVSWEGAQAADEDGIRHYTLTRSDAGGILGAVTASGALSTRGSVVTSATFTLSSSLLNSLGLAVSVSCLASS